MSNILSIDESEIGGFKANNTGKVGVKAHNSMEAYKNSMSHIYNTAFYSDDNSNFRSSINTLRTKMGQIEKIVDDVNLLLDELIDEINTEIIEKENDLAKKIVG